MKGRDGGWETYDFTNSPATILRSESGRTSPDEETRHTARVKLVESSVLEEEDRLWSPGNPLEWAARGYMSTGPDYHQDIVQGRTREWKRRYWALNVLLLLTGAGFFVLFIWLLFYGPSFGAAVAMALLLTGAAFLGVAALWIGRSVTNLEYGLRTPDNKSFHQEKEGKSGAPPRRRQ